MKLKCEGDPMSPEEVKRLIEDLHMPLSNELREISRIGLLLFYSMKTIEEIQLLGDVFWRIKNARMTDGNEKIREIWDTYYQKMEQEPAFNAGDSMTIIKRVQQEIAKLSYLEGLCSDFKYSNNIKHDLINFGRASIDGENLIRLGEKYGEAIERYLAENNLNGIMLNENFVMGAGIGRTIHGITIVGLAEDITKKGRFFIAIDGNNKIIRIPESEANNLIRLISQAIILEGKRYPL